ncbi:uncharacterized protein LOC143283547 [Babylonia areolata]|uniref:uncharacterized protein LOC143283547 n=1 Tax=Babylonia areolata TaxID=304850 RepID=UPI003FD44370
MEVDTAVSSERERLEGDQKAVMLRLQQKHAQELETLKQEAERRHREQVESLRAKLSGEHSREMEQLRHDMVALQAQEKQREEQELESARKRQAAIDDLDRGLDEVLTERMQELKSSHQQQLERLQQEQDTALRRMQMDMQEKLKAERERLSAELETEKKKLERQHERELEELKRKLISRREAFNEQLQEQEDKMQEKKADMERHMAYLDKSVKTVECQEKKLEERRQKFAAERERLEKEQGEAMGSRSSLASHELERMKEERQQLLSELQGERQQLEDLKNNRKDMEENVFKLKMEREQYSRHLKQMTEKVEKRQKDLEQLEDQILAAETQMPEHRSRQGATASNRTRGETGGLSLDDLSTSQTPADHNDEDSEDDVLQGVMKISQGYKGGLWSELLSDDDAMSTDGHVFGLKTRSQRRHVGREASELTRAKAYLEKQRRSLKRRQLALATASQELVKDISQKGESEQGARILGEVGASLENERQQLDTMEKHVRAGRRLLQQKEQKLQQLESHRHAQELLSDEESEFSPFDRRYQPAVIPNLDISDDDSSGISSTDVSLENYIHGLGRQRGSALATPCPPAESRPGNRELFQALTKINTDLSSVLAAVHADKENQGQQYQCAPIYVPSLSPMLGTGDDSRPLTAPSYTAPLIPAVDYSTLVLTAEQSLERKWHKYFGNRRPPISKSPLVPVAPSYGPTNVRDQLRQFRLSLLEVGGSGSKSTSTQLAEHKEWLRRFQDSHIGCPASGSLNVNFNMISSHGPTGFGGPGSDSGSLLSVGALSGPRVSNPLSSTTKVFTCNQRQEMLSRA